jgi:riboflavin biosynthesis pyrimidine reductase
MFPNINKSFSVDPAPLDELGEFYRIDEAKLSRERPYLWNIYVMSLTGIVSFLEHKNQDSSVGLGGRRISLGNLKGKLPEADGSDTDRRCLCYGWTQADAIIAGANILRVEPNATFMVPYEDMNEYRKRELGKELPPIRVLLTRKGFNSEELRYPIFNPGEPKTVIATSEKGYRAMEAEAEKLPSQLNPLDACIFEILGDSQVDLCELMKRLKEKYRVNLADLEGGPSTSHEFFLDKLVDEFRVTISPVFIDSLNDEGERRPISLEGKGYHSSNAPTGNIIGRRNFKEYTFIRTTVNYR